MPQLYLSWITSRANHSNYEKGWCFRNALGDVMGVHGIFAGQYICNLPVRPLLTFISPSADGEVWKNQRKLASHIFSAGNFRTHVQNTIHHGECSVCVTMKELELTSRTLLSTDMDTLDTLLAQVSKTGKDIELQDLFFRFTLSSFATMAFSADVKCLPSEPSGLDTKVEFATHFDFAQRVMDHRLRDPLQGFLERL